VDGGVDVKTAPECSRAGADTFISGTALFGQRNFTAAVRKLRKVTELAHPTALLPDSEPLKPEAV
jgi:ribulose-phosphate 3-epimerase